MQVLFPSDAQLTSRVSFAPHLTHKAQCAPPLPFPLCFFCTHTVLPHLFFVTSFIRYANKMQLVQAFATGGYVGPTPTSTGGG